MSKKTVFVNAALSTLAEQRLNEELVRILEEEGFGYYLPQHVVPPGSSMAADEVLETNLRAIEKSDIILSVLDKPGFGVAFELGYALASGKLVIVFRTDSQDYLGKIGEGLWENGRQVPEHYKVQSLEELRQLLRRMRVGEVSATPRSG